MCWWCGDPACDDGEKCGFDPFENLLLRSDTCLDAVDRIENIIGQGEVTYRPGACWVRGKRPSLIPGIREAVMGGPSGTGGMICPLCGKAIIGTNGHVDHKVPWQAYTEESARAAMREYGQSWAGDPIPEDFARIMSSDPDNLQATHIDCNRHKSDRLPGKGSGSVRELNRKAKAEEAARLREAQRKRTLQQQRERDERAAQRDSRWDRRRDPDSDSDSGGAGILA